jgi:hypothetical protein
MRVSTSKRYQFVVVSLVLLEAALLYFSGSSLAARGALYACDQLCGTALQHLVLVFAALYAVAMLVLPIIIGALCSRWQTAVLLCAVPWLIAIIGHAGSLLAPAFSLASYVGPFGGAVVGEPFWLNIQRSGPLLVSLVLFCALGFLGWLARQSLPRS